MHRISSTFGVEMFKVGVRMALKTLMEVDTELAEVQQKLNDMFAQQQRLIGYRIRILEEQQETEETKVEDA